MSSSKLWSALVVCAVACGGGTFHSSDDGNGGVGATSSGGDASTGGQVGSSGGAGQSGSVGAGGTDSGGSTSAGGDAGTAGTGVSSGGGVSVGGGNGGGTAGATAGGSGGSSGGVNGGGSGGTVDCSETGKLWTDYLALVAKAKICDLKITGECTSNSNIVTQGNCPIPVNSKGEYYDPARKALDAWRSAGCTFKITMCQAQIGTLGCQASTDPSVTSGTCGYSPIVAQ